jgi:hypothetical protein
MRLNRIDKNSINIQVGINMNRISLSVNKALKRVLRSIIDSSLLALVLDEKGIKTHFLHYDLVSDQSTLTKTMIPLMQVHPFQVPQLEASQWVQR